jgi:hypothetical protein
MIRNKLLEINQETWNSEKLDLTETFVKEFAISFSRFLDIQRVNFPCIYYSKNIHELLEIYENENRG